MRMWSFINPVSLNLIYCEYFDLYTALLGPVRNLTADVQMRSVTLRFSRPFVVLSDDYTYLIEYQNSTNNMTTITDTNFFIVLNLTPGTTYNFTVG